MLNYQDFFSSRRTLVATSSEMRVPTASKNIVKQSMNLSKPSQKHELLHSHSSDFEME